MLADAYKIASDIKQATTKLINEVSSASFESKIKTSLGPLKQRLASMRKRFANFMVKDLVKFLISHTYVSFRHMTPVNDCIIDMIKYVDVMIDNADKYYYDDEFTTRYSSEVGFVDTYEDFDNIDNPAIKCIKIIEKQRKPKIGRAHV